MPIRGSIRFATKCLCCSSPTASSPAISPTKPKLRPRKRKRSSPGCKCVSALSSTSRASAASLRCCSRKRATRSRAQSPPCIGASSLMVRSRVAFVRSIRTIRPPLGKAHGSTTKLFELVDIGVNLAHEAFAADRERVIERARAAGVGTLIVTGTSLETSAAAIALATDRAPGLYATAGVHPHDASRFAAETSAKLKTMAAHPAIRALGECGLDYNRNFSPRLAQLSAFEAQLELAVQLELPVFLHERDA